MSVWPWVTDSPEDRARRVALSYRHLVERIRFDAVADVGAELDALDGRWAELGAGWVKPTALELDTAEWVTARQLADMFHKTPQWVHNMGSRGHIEVRRIGDSPRYCVGDVLAYEVKRRQRRRPDQGK
ncbi:MAG TPA: hypothetical protein VMD08_17940 [Candidatus Baltobacteraceae bacterium]|nr:hypothetical protein [Candidatus Baltobacteraceae bacterium]